MVYNINPDAINENGKNNNGGFAKKEFNAKAYLSVMPPKGETECDITIRLLPISENGSPFLEVLGHDMDVVPSPNFSDKKFKTFMCPTNEGGEGKCPICEANKYYYGLANEAEKAMKDAISKGDQQTASAQKQKMEQYKECAKKYGKRTYFFVRCIERGKENEGVKFWRFPNSTKGDGIKDKIMAVYNLKKKKTGDNIFDLVSGYDLNVNIKTETDASGKPKRVFNIQLDEKCPLGTDEQITAWCDDTTKWQDLYPMKGYEYLKCVIKSGGRAPIWDSENKTYIPNMNGLNVPTQSATQTTAETTTASAEPQPTAPIVEQKPTEQVAPTTTPKVDDSDLPF